MISQEELRFQSEKIRNLIIQELELNLLEKLVKSIFNALVNNF